MKWSFFLGACGLTGAALLPHAPVVPVIGGMALAALILWLWNSTSRPKVR